MTSVLIGPNDVVESEAGKNKNKIFKLMELLQGIIDSIKK